MNTFMTESNAALKKDNSVRNRSLLLVVLAVVVFFFFYRSIYQVCTFCQ